MGRLGWMSHRFEAKLAEKSCTFVDALAGTRINTIAMQTTNTYEANLSQWQSAICQGTRFDYVF